jgi:predicted secreted Zn-dependent protease
VAAARSCPRARQGQERLVSTRPKLLEITLPGRPVPWARARPSKWGGFFTPVKQHVHRESLANLIVAKMQDQKIKPFEGPVGLIADSDIRTAPARIQG